MAISMTADDARRAAEAVERGKRQPTNEERLYATQVATANNQKAVWNPQTATFSYIPMSASEALENAAPKQAALEYLAGLESAPEAGPVSAADAAAASGAPPITSAGDVPGSSPDERFTNTVGRSMGGTQMIGDPSGAGSRMALADGDFQNPNNPYLGFEDIATPGSTGDQARDNAPTVDRKRIDDLTRGVSQYSQEIIDIADAGTLSAAEALLVKENDLANIRAANELRNSQSGALGAARSSRNRGDTALLERGAVSEQAYLGQEAQRQDVLRQAELAGNIATEAAAEEERDINRRIDARKTAADLGLNLGALDLDIEKTDIASANNLLNNWFQAAGIDATISADMTQAYLGFFRDMAALDLEYDKLDEASKQAMLEYELGKYGIDKSYAAQIYAADKAGETNWTDLATAFVGGAGEGGSAAAVTKLLTLSDRRAKTRITAVDDTADGDFERLIANTGAYKFEYKDPEDGEGYNFGVMAQDLEDSPFGESLVEEVDGRKRLDVGKLAAASFAGLGLLYRKVSELEKELS